MPWGKPGGRARFVPAFNNADELFGSSYATECYGVQNTDNVSGLDYVICHLDTPLGNTCGWMGTQSWGDDDNYRANSHHWTSVGYPENSFSGQVPMVEAALAVDDVDNDGDGKKLETSYLYSVPGWSGEPLWNFLGEGVREPGVVGIMNWFEDSVVLFLGEEDDVNAGGPHLVNLVLWGQANYPL